MPKPTNNDNYSIKEAERRRKEYGDRFSIFLSLARRAAITANR